MKGKGVTRQGKRKNRNKEGRGEPKKERGRPDNSLKREGKLRNDKQRPQETKRRKQTRWNFPSNNEEGVFSFLRTQGAETQERHDKLERIRTTQIKTELYPPREN